jgi:uncharacterized cupredoxin-like copper-binding protein
VGRVRWIGVVAVVVGLLVGGCGGDNGDGSSGSGEQKSGSSASSGGGAGATVKLSETEFKIDPADPKVAKAGKVRFEVSNDGQVVHALEVEGPGEEAETDNIQPGKSATLTVDLSKPGMYEMYCPVGNHKQQGMEGKISVAGGGSGSGSDDKGDDGGDDKGGSPSGY